MATPPVDYEALAKKFGAVASQPAAPSSSGPVDYSALAKQYGATASQPAQPEQAEAQPDPYADSSLIDKTIRFVKGALTPSAQILTNPVGISQQSPQGPPPAEGEHFDWKQALHSASLKNAALNTWEDIKQLNPFAVDQIKSGDVAGGVGHTLGNLTMLVDGARKAPEVEQTTRAPGTLVQKVKAPLGDTVIKPRGTVPAEAATPQELMQYAQQNNIPLNAAQATEHNLPRNIQTAGERATVGGTAVKKQSQAAQAAVATHVEKLMDQYSPISGTADLGSAIKQGVSDALDQQKQLSAQKYQAVDAAAKGVTVDLRPLKQLSQQMLGDTDFLRKNFPGLDPKRASGILKSLQQAPDNASFSEAQALRSGLLDETLHPDNAISQQAQGWLKRATGQLDGDMMQAAQQSPGLEQAFRDANGHWRQLQEDFNNPRSPLSQILQEPDPSRVPQQFTAKGQTGGSPYRADILAKYGVDQGMLKRAILQDITNKDFALFKGKNLAGYSDEFLRSVFSPEELGDIYKSGAIARSVGLNVNKSGTAGAESALQDVQKPVRSLLPKAAAAKAINSLEFNRWLMSSPENRAAWQQYVNTTRATPVSVLELGAADANANQQ